MSRKYLSILLIIYLGNCLPCFGHGDLHERILIITEKINASPDSASLYFERAKLYFYHEQFSLSLSDLDETGKLGFEDPLRDLFYAKANQKLNKHETTLVYTDKILAYDSLNVNAIKIKAEVLFAQEQFLDSALAYEKLINTSRRTLPENYLNASKAWRNSDSQKEQKNAIHIIDRGISELGSLPVFLKRQKEYYLEDKNYEEALRIQEIIISASRRKETAFLKAAEIAILKKDFERANDYLSKSEEAFKKLPRRIQGNKAMKILKTSIQNNKILLTNKH